MHILKLIYVSLSFKFKMALTVQFFQNMHLFSVLFCDTTAEDRSRYRESLRDLITWSKTLPVAKKQKIGTCLTKGLSKALTWSFCCGEVSKYNLIPVIKLFHASVCLDKVERTTDICGTLTLLSDGAILNNLFKIIDWMKICECPINLGLFNDLIPQTQNTTTHNRVIKTVETPIVKRQFDAVSTAMIFSEILCDQGKEDCKVHSPAQIRKSIRQRRDDSDYVRQFEALIFVGRDVLCCFVG